MKNNYSMRIRSAISLTVAFSLILSGVYFAWLSPINEYPNYLELGRISTVLDPEKSSSLMFEGKRGMTITYGFDTPYQQYNEKGEPLSPNISFSLKLYNPDGKVVRSHENVILVANSQSIPLEDSGTYRLELTNDKNQTVLVNLYVQDISKNIQRPLEPVGHWFIFMALPIIGLGIWFAIVKIETKPEDAKI